MEFSFNQEHKYFQGCFAAMASSCEVLIDTHDESLAREVFSIARNEALRIEKKFSRYRTDNLVYKINSAAGKAVSIDEEFYRLLQYAQQCYDLSEGMFDITSGALRRCWRFDGSENLPTSKSISETLQSVGWKKVKYSHSQIKMPVGMEIDLGGMGKEYAVDRSAALIKEKGLSSVLINYGGDLVSLGSRRNGSAWEVGLSNVNANISDSSLMIKLSRGAVATSGDANRYIETNGVRYGHILNPRTGWPIEKAPRQVTVLAPTCMEAGMLATFSLLKGKEAEKFLAAQEVEYKIFN